MAPTVAKSWTLLKQLSTLACAWLPTEQSPISWLVKTVPSCNQHP